MVRDNSPYLADPNRLGDVIAAIQAMSTYKFYKLEFEGWSDRISGTTTRAQHWQQVFEQHPEFFRLDGERKRASLVWRRQYLKRYHVDRETKISHDEYDRLSDPQKLRVSRVPLTPEDIKTLIDTAIDIHSRALEAQKEKRWWVPLASAVGALIGAVLGAWLEGRFAAA